MRIITLFTDKFVAFFLHFGIPFSNVENKVTGLMKHAAVAVTDCVSLFSFKKIIIIKLNKIYFEVIIIQMFATLFLITVII